MQSAAEFHKDLAKATLALYERHPHTDADDFMQFDISTGKKKRRIVKTDFIASFTCTATVIANPEPNVYFLLTAGHCFGGSNPESKYYVSEGIDVDPTLQRVEVLKSANTKKYDYALLLLHSAHQYPVIRVNLDKDLPEVETPLVNVNFSLGLTQQLIKGEIESGIMQREQTEPGCEYRFMTSLGVGPGASGSAIVDENSREIIGIVEAIFPGYSVGTVSIPLGKQFDNFMIDDSILEKAPPVVHKSAPEPDEETISPLRAGAFVLLLMGLILSVIHFVYLTIRWAWKKITRKRNARPGPSSSN